MRAWSPPPEHFLLDDSDRRISRRVEDECVSKCSPETDVDRGRSRLVNKERKRVVVGEEELRARRGGEGFRSRAAGVGV